MHWMIAIALLGADNTPGETRWPAFRGTGLSSATAANLPLEWGADKNIAWTFDVAGYGQSSPVVWENRVFVTSADGPNKDELITTAIDLKTGKSVWSKALDTSTKIKVSDYVSRSAPTPVVDANRVYSFFESGDFVAYDHEGKQLWTLSLTKDYGAIQGNHGLGGSPALTEDAVVVLVDHAGPSYLIALDKTTGKTLWKTDREPRVSWSSPIIVDDPNGPRIVISSNKIVEAFDAKTGKRIWWFDQVEGNTVASPTVTKDSVIVGSSQIGNNFALKRDGTGKLTDEHIAWRSQDATSSFGSPLVHNDHVYFVNRSGGVVCADLKTGATIFKARLPGSCWASPVGAGERIYFFTKSGDTVVIAPDKEWKPLAENSLPTTDRIYGSALVKNTILLRTGSQVICIRNSAS